MQDPFIEKIKKQYELRVIEQFIGRCYPMEDVANARKKNTIFEEAEVFYRDHIHGLKGADATHHNVERRFPSLNGAIRAELSSFAEKMGEAGDQIDKIEAVLNSCGAAVSFSAERLKTLIKSR